MCSQVKHTLLTYFNLHQSKNNPGHWHIDRLICDLYECISFQASGYWLGSYNFHEDITVVSNTNFVQVMTSTDRKSCEQNLPESQCCSCRSHPFSWESYNCSTELPFICEFQTGSK